MTPDDFYNSHVGLDIDWDGAYGTQCVDGFKVFCQWAGIPAKATPNNWADGYWIYRDSLGFSQYFDYIYDASQLRDGDWCIWMQGSSCARSHISMYYRGKFFGERQVTGNTAFTLVSLEKDIAGALRWKGWNDMDQFRYGLNKRTFEGAELEIYKGYDGFDSYIISAGEGQLKNIRGFDDPELLIVSMVNAGYFQMKTDVPGQPYGTHYGVEQSINGVDLAPKKDGLLVFYETLSGEINWCRSSHYYWSQPEVKFAITPYSVLRHNGESLHGVISTDLGNKETLYNEQTMIARVNDHWFHITTKTKVLPSLMLRFAESINAEEAVLMDSGGSTQHLGWSQESGSFEDIIVTNRPLPNVAVIAKKKDHSDTGGSEPVQSDNGGKEEEPMEPADNAQNEDMTTPDKITGLFGLTNEWYDRLKWFALVGMPAIIVFLTSIMDIWHMEHAKEIIGTLSAINVLLGMMLGISSIEYAKRKNGDQ